LHVEGSACFRGRKDQKKKIKRKTRLDLTNQEGEGGGLCRAPEKWMPVPTLKKDGAEGKRKHHRRAIPSRSEERKRKRGPPNYRVIHREAGLASPPGEEGKKEKRGAAVLLKFQEKKRATSISHWGGVGRYLVPRTLLAPKQKNSQKADRLTYEGEKRGHAGPKEGGVLPSKSLYGAGERKSPPTPK